MSRPSAFWDTSALLPLVIEEPKSLRAANLYPHYSVVVWWATEVEIHSGLARLRREKSLTQGSFIGAQNLFGQLACGWLIIHESPTIAPSACRLLELHPLRAADALQLAAALEACEHNPLGFPFITADQRLADAARQMGFLVEFL